MLKAISEMVPTFSMVMKQHHKYDLYLKSLFLFLKKNLSISYFSLTKSLINPIFFFLNIYHQLKEITNVFQESNKFKQKLE